MTLAAGFAHPRVSRRDDETTKQAMTLPLWRVVIVSLLAVFVISLPNLLDPFIRHDDYPALLGDADLFWSKTLHEGRWLNYIWHLRGVVTPAWLNFAVYQALWAVLAAALAVAAMGRDGRMWFGAVLAVLIAVASPAVLISVWFNTLIPGLGLVTLYAVLGCRLSQRRHRALLPVFVIVTFWAYTTYPLILLAVCLLRTRERSLADLIGLMSLFVASFAAAVVLTYTLNWQIHGVFGVPLDDWRLATPAADVAGMIANLPLLGETFQKLLVLGSYNILPVAYLHPVLLVVATAVMIARAPREALYLHAGLWAGMALIMVQVLKLGVFVPPRTFIFAWVFYAVIVVRAAALLSEGDHLGGRIMRNLAVLVGVFYLMQAVNQSTIYRPWQAETRALGEALIAANPPAERPVLIYGDVMTLDSAKAAYLQRDIALISRMRQLTGHTVVLCHGAPEDCTQMVAARDAAGLPDPIGLQVVTSEGGVRLSGLLD